MLLETLKQLFSRDLNRLRNEIEQYNHEPDIWTVKAEINNSAGNLCLHLIGNLNTYIGKELGGTGYIRNRNEEFSLKNVPKQELIKKIETTIIVINETLDHLNPDLLESEYPVVVFDRKTTIEYLLVHLASHFNYHLGQINYHRRLVANNKQSLP